MCRLIRAPRSTYYAWTHRAETPTQARRRALAAETTQEFDDSRQTLGCRRIAAALGRRGVACSVGLVADLMRELGLAAVQPRAYRRTTLPGDDPIPAPDLIGRDFTAAATLNIYSHLWPDRGEQTRAAVGAVLRARQPGKDQLC
jgi:hypothetical protein